MQVKSQRFRAAPRRAGAGFDVRLVALGARSGHVFAGLAAVTEAARKALEEGRRVGTVPVL